MSMPAGEGRGHVPRLRLSLVAVVAVALFASLFARLYDLQVVGADKYQVQAEANRVRTVQVPAPRGASSTATARSSSTTAWRSWWPSIAAPSASCRRNARTRCCGGCRSS